MIHKRKYYFEIKSTKNLKLSKIPVLLNNVHHSKQKYKDLLDKNHKLLEEYQTLLYANHERALLIIFQGMDTSGKDGAIKHVMSGVNPQGCSVFSFKLPTSKELEHDFLWRANQLLPARGQIGIFNRSYYEEALITRVHPQILELEKLPRGTKFDEKFWTFRYIDIVNFEKYLHRQGFEIIKIFIHISKTEQKKRLIARFQDATKHWKISESDIRERMFWKKYQWAYEECIRHTVSKSSPWYIVPGDDKENARLSISKILVDRLKKMKLDYPKLKPEEKNKLKKLRSLLAKED